MARPFEIAWFAALCDDDYEFLGVPDPALRSSWQHCERIVRTAETCGYDNILLPSGYELGIDTTAFAAAIAPTLRSSMRMLVAVRVGETWPPQLARQLATLDEISEQRLTINIISSDRPGESLPGPQRYERTLELMHVLRDLLNGTRTESRGAHFDLTIDPPRNCRDKQCPPMYFGGLSDEARDVAAQAADVYLMWPETERDAAALIEDMRSRAAHYGRTLRFGFRVHVIVRPTEAEARAAATRLLSRLDAEVGEAIRAKSLDSTSIGVAHQRALREASDGDGFVEAQLWTGIGRARSGCGAAIVGDPQQVRDKLLAYHALGIDSFILSGYPHVEECRNFSELVMPLLDAAAP